MNSVSDVVIAHGDVDGIVSAAEIIKAYGLKRETTKLVFTQPFLVDQIPQEFIQQAQRIFVVDIAVNNRDPEMTMKFIEKIWDKLTVWYDHHQGWSRIQGKLGPKFGKFIIETTNSCAELVAENEGLRSDFVRELVRDAIAADTRRGQLSEIGELIDQAIKSDLGDDTIREAAVRWLAEGAPQDPENKEYRKLLEAQQKYREIKETTEQLINQYEIRHGIAVVDVTQENRDYDRTQLLIAGQKMAPTGISVVIGKNPEGEEIVTIATNRKDINLVALFGLPSGAPFRISLPTAEWPLKRVLEKLKNLADPAKPFCHQYFVDLTPVMADCQIGPSFSPPDYGWKTVLMCGERQGGKSYFALDITDDDDVYPKPLWRFTDTRLGETWSVPQIGIVKTGSATYKWIGIFGSGYDNGNGEGYLYGVDVADGSQIFRLNVDSATGPSGNVMASPVAIDWNNNTLFDRVYIGDMLGRIVP